MRLSGLRSEQRDPSRGETMAAKDKFVTIYAPHNVGFMKYEGKLG